ncbi:MAG: ankyrin repeat domain-containing protein, partial [Dehalococcoidia bacterium]|nr:ankyrin repeat domain-containing protein [Dehalococcoidia bacterium]
AAGADVNVRNSDGNAVIYEAVWRGDAEIVQFLVDAGANPNALDADDSPILIEAA